MRDYDRGLTQERLKQLVHYDEVTGDMTRLHSRGAAVAGSVVKYRWGGGSNENDGYYGVRLDGHLYYCHRLAWFYVHGVWPANEIDHIDGCRTNNALANLREATPAQNRRNLGRAVNNKSGVKGVTWCKRSKSWSAGLQLFGRRIFLGRHKKIEDAIAARAEGERIYFGEFARAA